MNVTSATLFPGLDGFARSLYHHLRLMEIDDPEMYEIFARNTAPPIPVRAGELTLDEKGDRIFPPLDKHLDLLCSRISILRLSPSFADATSTSYTWNIWPPKNNGC